MMITDAWVVTPTKHGLHPSPGFPVSCLLFTSVLLKFFVNWVNNCLECHASLRLIYFFNLFFCYLSLYFFSTCFPSTSAVPSVPAPSSQGPITFISSWALQNIKGGLSHSSADVATTSHHLHAWVCLHFFNVRRIKRRELHCFFFHSTCG